MVLAAAEAVLSGRCCLVALIFRGIGPCARSYVKEQVRPISLYLSPCLCPTTAAFCCLLKVLGSAGLLFPYEQAVQQWEGGMSHLNLFQPALVTDWHPFILGSCRGTLFFIPLVAKPGLSWLS